MKKPSFAPKFLLYAMGLVLLLYTAYRTVSLVSQTLPKEAALLSIAAVVAFDGGIIAWLFYFTRGAKSNQQVAIAGGMIFVDFIGVAILFISHTLLNERLYAQNPDTLRNLGILAIWTLVIGTLANVGALLLSHAFDPDEIMTRARRDVEAEISRKAVELVEAEAAKLAGQVAPGLARDTLERARLARIGSMAQPAFLKDSQPPLQISEAPRRQLREPEELEDVQLPRMPIKNRGDNSRQREKGAESQDPLLRG